MKKGIEWLSMMSKEEQVLFLKNLNNVSKIKISTYLMADYKTFRPFILNAFSWRRTPEGSDYWMEICTSKDTI